MSGRWPVAVSAADVNRDGILDTLTRHHERGSNDVGISLGRGDGSFHPAIYVPIAALEDGGIVVDLDGDGLSEAVRASGEQLTIQYSTDDWFTLGLPVAADFKADLNNDGHLDSISLSLRGDRDGFLVALSNGDATFRDWSFDRVTQGSQPKDIVPVDVNNDGHVDLVVGNQETSDVAMFLARSDGTFELPRYFSFSEWGQSLAAGDFDQDGNMDLVIGVGGGPFVSHRIVFGNGDGTFSREVQASKCSNCDPQQLSVTDLNDDGYLDLVSTGGPRRAIAVWLGVEGGRLGRPMLFGPGDVSGGFGDHAVTDVNGDGMIDVVAINSRLSRIEIFFAIESGGELRLDPVPVGAGAYGLAVGDLNNDGFQDILAATFQSDDLTLLLTDRTSIPRLRRTISLHSGASPVEVLVTDLNDDGSNDLLIATAGTCDLTMLLGRGDGTFETAVRLPLEISPTELIAYDPSGEGLPVIAITDSGADEVHLLRLGAVGQIRIEESDVVVANLGVELARVPSSESRTLAVTGTSGDDEIVVELPESTAVAIEIDAGSGTDTIRWLTGDGYSAITGVLTSVETIDLRNSQADVLKIGELEADRDLHSIVDIGDSFRIESGWTLRAPIIRDGEFYRVIERAGLRMFIESGAPWQNPINRFDVNGNMSLDPLDILDVVNELNRRRLTPQLPHPIDTPSANYRYFDTNGDGFLSSADALLVVNWFNQGADDRQSEAESVSLVPQLATREVSEHGREDGESRSQAPLAVWQRRENTEVAADRIAIISPQMIRRVASPEEFDELLSLFPADPGTFTSDPLTE